MSEHRFTFDRCPTGGDIRQLGKGDEIVLAHRIRDREDWSLVLMALATAVARGAQIRWERT